MRTSPAPLRRRCDGCVVAAVAIAGALACARCALEVRRHHAAPLLADLVVTVPYVPGGPRAPRAPASGPSAGGGSTALRSGARGAPAERSLRAPRRGLSLSAPSDDRRGLPAIRRQRGAFLVRAVDPGGAAIAVDPRDLPHRPSGSPHRELLRRVIGL